jgi:hypothetical protein
MATILAAANGNFNATGTWTGGVVPGTGDIAVANGKTITVTASVTCQEFQVLSTSTVANGYFVLSAGVTMTATVRFYVLKSGDNGNAAFYFSGSAGTSASMVGPLVNDPSTVGISSPGASAWGVIQNTSTGTLNITGDINVSTTASSGGNMYGVWNKSSGAVYITGNILAGSNVGPYIQGVRNESTGRVDINGSVFAGPGSSSYTGNSGGVFNVGAGTINITFSGTAVTGGGGNLAYGVNNSSLGTLSITGNILGASAPGVNNLGTATINGNVTGGAGGAGLINSLTATVTGTATGGAGAAGITNSGTINASSGNLVVKGNAFGVGATVTAQYGLVNTNVAYVQSVEYGDLGMSPVSGAVWLTDVASNQSIMYRSGLSKKTLVDAASTASYVPAVSDVRLGTVYNSTNNTGTCAIPAAGSVALGVAVDATAGTAALTPAAVWAYLTASATTSGSMGERLKNAGTVATIGQQIADSLV